MNLSDLIGQTFDFYGVDGNAFKLGDMRLEAVEDPEDGYRSCLAEVREAPVNSIFFPNPVARVTVEEVTRRQWSGYSTEFRGWELVDDTGHRWLLVGTDDWWDYYPCFTFEYTPRQ